MTAPLRDVFAWMISTIQNDSEIQSLGYSRVFAYKAPENFDFPYFILEKQTGAHDYVFGNEAHNRHFIVVKSLNYGTDGGDLGRRAMDRVRELLNNQRPALTEGYVMVIRANTDFEFVEAETGNNQFFNVGTVYLVQLAG